MLYYYLDGLEKKGPYSSDELKARNVSDETLVFADGMKNWTAIKDLPELLAAISTPDESLVQIPKDERINKEENENEIKSKPEISTVSKIRIPTYIFLIILYSVSVATSYFLVERMRDNDRKLFESKIEQIFQHKDAVTDYQFEGTNGQLYDVNQTSLFGIGENNIVKTSKRTLAMKPSSDYGNMSQWNIFKDLVQYYESVVFTGFDVLRLDRSGMFYTVTKMWSGDMAYKVAESRHVEGFASSFYNTPGYDVPTYRPSVSKCYEEAAKYLTEEREDKSYVAGSYNRLDNFSETETKFYRLNQNYPKYTRLVNKIHVEMDEKNAGDAIDNSKITDATSASDANVYSNQWIVWYKSITNKFGLEEKEGVFAKLWLIYSMVGIVIATLIYLLLKYRSRITFN